jgi:hypothetical protein
VVLKWLCWAVLPLCCCAVLGPAAALRRGTATPGALAQYTCQQHFMCFRKRAGRISAASSEGEYTTTSEDASASGLFCRCGLHTPRWRGDIV